MTTGSKLYYRMGKVCEITELEPHVLRFWENEFPSLTPRKNRSGHRTYTQDDINLILRIKKLLHNEGYTIAGALQKIENHSSNEPEPPLLKKRVLAEIKQVKTMLENTLKLLDSE